MKINYRDPVWALALIACLFFGACSPAAKLRRAEKLIKKAEEMGAKWHVDTLMIEVPIVVPSVRVDSIIVAKAGDTVVIQKDRLKLKYVRLIGDTVFITAECETDTIYKEVPVTITKTIKAKYWLKWWMLLIAFAAGIIFWVGYRQVN